MTHPSGFGEPGTPTATGGRTPSWAAPEPDRPVAAPPTYPTSYPPPPPPWAGPAQPSHLLGGSPSLPPGRGTASGTNALAITSFVLGLLAVWPVGLVLGIIALVQIARRAQPGRIFAWFGIALSTLWMLGVIAVLVVVAHGLPARQGPLISGPDGDGQSSSLDDLKQNVCVRAVGRTDHASPVAVPCDGPHGGQVFAQLHLPKGTWPGKDAVSQQAEAECSRLLETTTVSVEDDAHLYYIFPSTRAQWVLHGRTVVCLVSTPSWSDRPSHTA